ncbi:tripartite tricarboxylate transporter substrate binding protein [Dankookia rubra]|uniref:Tripartite tricarboxylate transporter substrate binding protein n=1 Tax=Dankookia rubra TaxID=1442381 RepID=A0A4V3A9V6_9PROT|nr:tripartite tricarboxylate transporter substrate binding protein [Dankookia rubra]TDH60735.1 tripartite tricarboxylate transporter substrate binding protein [Dankookia rubra]
MTRKSEILAVHLASTTHDQLSAKDRPVQLPRRALLGGSLAAALIRPATAQPDASWPSRPVRVVVPWPAGGPTDTYGRAVARELAPLLGQPVVVDNRTGATGTVGVQHVARSAADGHTLLVANTTAFIGSVVALGEAVQFDPLQDFVPIGLFVESVSVLWAHPSFGIEDFGALLARAQDPRRPPLAFGTTGSGSVSEQAVEQLARHFRLELTKVPYRGTAPQLADLVAGHVQIGSADYATAGPHFREGRLRPLLVIGHGRMPELPEVPTTAELGLSEPDFTIWNGMLAPLATPTAIVERLRTVLAEAIKGDAFRAVANGNGNRAIFETGDTAVRRLARELAARRAFAREVGLSG